MAYCVNPNCTKPENVPDEKFCIHCGGQILLKDRFKPTSFFSAIGMSRNFIAIDENTADKKMCFVKQFCPHPSNLNDPSAWQQTIQLFNLEAEKIHKLGEKSNHIPRLVAFFQQEQRFYLVQEDLQGKTLTQLLKEEGIYEEEKIYQLLNDVSPILKFIHSKGVIHRNIQPENIIKTDKGNLALINFGISRDFSIKLMSMGTQINVLGYAPPEQIAYGQVFQASDIYAVGVTCIHLLTNIPPEQLFDPLQNSWIWKEKIEENGIKINKELTLILDKMLSVVLAKRYQSVDMIINELESPSVHKLELIVDQKGNGDYNNITEAIKKALPKTRIIVKPGEYQESIIIDKYIEIIGDGKVKNVVIKAVNSHGVSMGTYDAKISNLTISAVSDVSMLDNHAIYIPEGRLIVENCDIISDNGFGIFISGKSANPMISKCKIHDSKKGGILVEANAQGTIEDCDIFANQDGGIEIREGASPIIINCQIHDNKSSGLFAWRSGKGLIEKCDVFGNNKSGVEIKENASPTVRSCQIRENKQNGVWVLKNGQGVIEKCDIFNNNSSGVEIREGGNPTVRSCKIHDGKSCGVLVVINGQGTIDNCDIFANVYSGIGISDNANPMVRNCKIRDGKSTGLFVWKNGQGVIEKCDIFGNAYAGIAIRECGNPTIRNCKIYNGRQYGVLVVINGEGLIDKCEIYNNTLSGVEIKEGGNPIIRGCKIHDGKMCGVLVSGNSQGTIENCEIFANHLAGLEIKEGGNPIVRNCKIYEGKSDGVLVWSKGLGLIENCEIFSNTLSGVEIREEGNPTVKNCQINRNQEYAVYVHDNGEGNIENCNFTYNPGGFS